MVCIDFYSMGSIDTFYFIVDIGSNINHSRLILLILLDIDLDMAHVGRIYYYALGYFPYRVVYALANIQNLIVFSFILICYLGDVYEDIVH